MILLLTAVVVAENEGLAVNALTNRRIGLMCANLDLLKRTITVTAVISTLLYCAADAAISFLFHFKNRSLI